MKQANNII